MEIAKYIRDTPLECIYAPKKKLWLDAAISATASHINTAINWLANRETNKANKQINQQQIDFARESFDKEKEYNNWLLGNQKQMQMSDARQAGANPAFAQGSLLGGMSTSPHQNQPNLIPMDYNFDASGISQGVQHALDYLLNKKAVEANARKTNADAEAQELLNEDKKAKNNALNQEYESVWMHHGKVISDEEAQRIFDSQNGNNVDFPDFVKRKDPRGDKGAEGRFSGHQMLREWRSRQNALVSQDWKNAFDTSVNRLRLNDSGVMEAFTQMPKKEFDRLTEIITSLANENSIFDKHKEMLDIEIDMAKLQKQIQEDSNLYQYISKMFDGDFTWKDFGKLLAMTLVGLFQNIGGIGVGITNLKSLGSSRPARIGFR